MFQRIAFFGCHIPRTIEFPYELYALSSGLEEALLELGSISQQSSYEHLAVTKILMKHGHTDISKMKILEDV